MKISFNSRSTLLASALLGLMWHAGAAATTQQTTFARPAPEVIESTEEEIESEGESDLLDAGEPADEVLPQTKPSEVPQDSRETIEAIDKEILETSAEMGFPKNDGVASIPVEINQNVRKWIHYFSNRDQERFQRFLDRGEAYRGLVKRVLAEQGVPTELYYLAMIESGYVIHARSHAAAVGPWQFIRGTGQRYGLALAPDIDERRDIVRATESAARYLRGLHLVFQDWYLAMAAYNAGEGRIVGAVMRGESRDFWKLVEKKVLPEETRDYVPKFLAAAIIGHNPEKYGFSRNEVEAFPAFEPAVVRSGVSLSLLAEKAGIPSSVLTNLNPHLLRGRTPRGGREYTIWVPAGSGVRVAEIASTLESVREAPVLVVRPGGRYHKVRAGESLGSIAKRYGVSLTKLKKMNGLRTSKVMPGKRLVIAPTRRSVSMR